MIVVLVIRRSSSDELETIPRRNLLDRAVIAARLDRDRVVLPRAAYAIGLESYAPEIFTKRGGSHLTVAVGLESDAPEIFTKRAGSRLTVAVGLESDAPRIFTKSGGSRFTWPSDR